MTVPSSLVLIAGGSGSGKTTLAEGLIRRHPDWTHVQLDDYIRPKSEVPMLDGRRNWESPSAIDFDRLIPDLQALLRGEAIVIEGWSRQARRDQGRRERFTIVPGPTVILEGYLALWHPVVRALAAYRVFLEAPKEARHARRRWFKDQAYLDQVLEPMHRLHVEPTSAYADLVLFAGAETPDSILESVDLCLKLHV
jgi:uridine kinase